MGPIEGNCPHGNYRPACVACEREACAIIAEREPAGKSCHCPAIGREIAKRIRSRALVSGETEQSGAK